MKNMILKTISALSLSVIFGIAIDFSNPLPSVVLYGAALVWLTLFSIANAGKGGRKTWLKCKYLKAVKNG